MGGMGGGMGGMGGGGFRSVPPSSAPFATLKPNQTRHLPTRLVGLSQPNPETPVVMPEEGEALRIGEIGQLTNDERIKMAVRRLSAAKAPQSVAQLALWRVAGNLEWEVIGDLSKNWANAREITLAKQFTEKLESLPAGESGSLHIQIAAKDASLEGDVDQIKAALKDAAVLGLPVQPEVPSAPDGPSLACRISVSGTAEKAEALVQVSTTNADATAWSPAGKFTLPVVRDKDGKVKAEAFADALAEGVLGRLVRATLSKGPRVKGKPTYKLRVENLSPLLVNGVEVLGIDKQTGAGSDERNRIWGISISPGKSMTVPASSQLVEAFGLKKGVRIMAADLSGL
jgi:hypothetical protein